MLRERVLSEGGDRGGLVTRDVELTRHEDQIARFDCGRITVLLGARLAVGVGWEDNMHKYENSGIRDYKRLNII